MSLLAYCTWCKPEDEIVRIIGTLKKLERTPCPEGGQRVTELFKALSATTKTDEVQASKFVSEGGIPVVRGCINAYPNDRTLRSWGCKVLLSVAFHSKAHEEQVINAGGYDVIVDTMLSFAEQDHPAGAPPPPPGDDPSAEAKGASAGPPGGLYRTPSLESGKHKLGCTQSLSEDLRAAVMSDLASVSASIDGSLADSSMMGSMYGEEYHDFSDGSDGFNSDGGRSRRSHKSHKSRGSRRRSKREGGYRRSRRGGRERSSSKSRGGGGRSSRRRSSRDNDNASIGDSENKDGRSSRVSRAKSIRSTGSRSGRKNRARDNQSVATLGTIDSMEAY